MRRTRLLALSLFSSLLLFFADSHAQKSLPKIDQRDTIPLRILNEIQAQQPVLTPGSTPGEFSVSPSGAATYTIPLQVPPGVAGMAPRLALVYSSQGGNGMLGMGWGLSGLSAITRCPQTRAQDGNMSGVNFDMNDRFCLDGQRLIVISGNYGAAGSEYRTELDSFSKIIANGQVGNGPASFTVKTKSGLTMEYGTTTDSFIEATGKPTARVWAQSKVSDVKGNFYTVSYNETQGAYYPSHYTQVPPVNLST